MCSIPVILVYLYELPKNIKKEREKQNRYRKTEQREKEAQLIKKMNLERLKRENAEMRKNLEIKDGDSLKTSRSSTEDPTWWREQD